MKAAEKVPLSAVEVGSAGTRCAKFSPDTARFRLYTSSMRDSFTHKFLMILFASFCAAGLVYVYRHVVVSAIQSTSDAAWVRPTTRARDDPRRDLSAMRLDDFAAAVSRTLVGSDDEISCLETWPPRWTREKATAAPRTRQPGGAACSLRSVDGRSPAAAPIASCAIRRGDRRHRTPGSR